MNERLDREYWSDAPIREKLETITYLRECFYGKEATTGRLQRIYTVFKHDVGTMNNETEADTGSPGN